ncbi:laccase domain protein [Betaproteobacteria bacterium]|nr:laccase domain protein [Betaproteobacteria bacterium]
MSAASFVPAPFIVPDWPAPAAVRAVVTTRHGGVSAAPWASFNLATHVGDEPTAVAANRARLRLHLPAEPCWLEQVHGCGVVDAGVGTAGVPVADAAVTRTVGRVCAVLTADCLPVLFCDEAGSVVAVAHAGWRGLAAGVLEATVAKMALAPACIMAWLGPAIGPTAFEVGGEVRAIFLAHDAEAEAAFVASRRAGKWLADLFVLARQRLAAMGGGQVYGGGVCTASDTGNFFSYRREGQTGRFASLVWLAGRA